MHGLNALDFNDLLGLTVALLKSDRGLREQLRRKYTHVLVGECHRALTTTASSLLHTPVPSITKLLADENKDARPHHA